MRKVRINKAFDLINDDGSGQVLCGRFPDNNCTSRCARFHENLGDCLCRGDNGYFIIGKKVFELVESLDTQLKTAENMLAPKKEK